MNLTKDKKDVENIKVIIFDFDDTLYMDQSWEHWSKYVENFFFSVFKSEDKVKEILQKYNITYLTNGMNIALALIDEMGSAKSFIKYQTQNIYKHDYIKVTNISNDDIAKLKEKYALYIVSNSVKKYVLWHLKLFGINKKYFKKIYQNNFLVKDSTKAYAYKKILKREKVMPEKVLVVGDNYENDIAPALELNMQGAHVHSLEETQNIINKLLK